MKTLSLVLILFLVIIIVVGIIKIHDLPGKIAKQRNHPQAEAIMVCSLLGLLIFPFWMFALLWSYMRPVFSPLTLTNTCTQVQDSHKSTSEGEQ